jgi:glutathione S-transferase
VQWLVWTNVTLNEALSRYQHNASDRIPAERKNAQAAEFAKAEVEKYLAILDGALKGKTWLVGDAFSLVDLHAAGWVEYVGMCGFDTSKLANISAWVKRASDRPGHAIAMAPPS